MTQFLSRAFVDYELAFKRGLRDAYRWHQAVWEAFPGRDDAPRDFLTRLDVQDRGFQLLLLSSDAPARPDWCPTDTWETKSIPEDFFDHRQYAFQLRANPTRKLRVDLPDGTRKKNGVRVPLTQREALEAWLARKADAGGFQVDTAKLRIHPARKERFFKPGNGSAAKAMHGVLQGMEFKGVLTVSDRAKFLEAFSHGIGSAKSFGFGLLALAPLSAAD